MGSEQTGWAVSKQKNETKLPGDADIIRKKSEW